MAKIQGLIKLIPAIWTDTAEEELQRVYQGDDKSFLDDVRQDVISGNATLYNGFHNKKHIGYCVARIETFASGYSELVIVAVVGRSEAGSLIDTLFSQWLILAKQQGCKSVRVHTNNKAMMRTFEKHGLIEVERIFKIEVL